MNTEENPIVTFSDDTTIEAIYLPSALVVGIEAKASNAGKQEIVKQASAGVVDETIADAVIKNTVQSELELGNVAFEIEKDEGTGKSGITLALEVKESGDLTNWSTLTNIATKVETETGVKGFYKFTVPQAKVE